jgi:hypothetical protein
MIILEFLLQQNTTPFQYLAISIGAQEYYLNYCTWIFLLDRLSIDINFIVKILLKNHLSLTLKLFTASNIYIQKTLQFYEMCQILTSIRI